ncbi:hypothetical protein AVEN_42643-1 [Araneus ventricosus]|uniref:Uncharacterized protein n=1 Tax=Araneus ventricosus TaxID=182803 RepID=A0A4Y2BNC1_ARAVE|nr:hypothetical protein AVEN_42643-1 [Araneus ventricosus]
MKILQKSFKKQKGSLLKVTDKLRNSKHNWKPKSWLMEVESGDAGKLQKGLITDKHWSDSEISLAMNWAMDVRHDQAETSKMDKTERKETIQILNELREKLDTVCVGANCGKAIGNGGQILGAGGAIIGVVMSFYGLPSGPDITNIGSLVHHGGTLIDNASKAIESRCFEKYLKKVAAVLNEDKKISQPLEKWLEYMMELDPSVKAIFGVSPASGKWNIVAKVCMEFGQLAKSGIGINKVLNLMNQGKYSIHIGNDVQIAALEKLYDSMSASPLLADKIRSTLSVSNVTPEHVKRLIQILKAGCSCQEMYSSLFCSKLQGGLNPEITTAWEISSFGGFRAISLAYSYVSLVDAASIIRRGGSRHSDALKRIVKALDGELKLIKSLNFNKR